MRDVSLLALLMLWLVTSPPKAAWGQEAPGRGELRRMAPPTVAAVDRGLQYLASRQNEDGSFGSGGQRGNVAIAALAGMAFMSHGDLPGRGPYGEHVRKTAEFLLANAAPSGFIYNDQAGTHGPMYGHGFATLFLSEYYGTVADPRIREQLSKAVKLIIDSQNAEGGWRYIPEPVEADISVTICQIMALRSARNAGLNVPKATIDRCVEYVKRCQNGDGGFMYRLSQPGESSFPRSAAGVVALYSAGLYDTEEIRRGVTYVNQFLPTPAGRREQYYFYGHYYAVQAMWQAGGDSWNRWYAAIHDELLAQQTKEGVWLDLISSEYGTAMACLILQTPQSHLPIFQR